MEPVKLKNGATELAPMVNTITMILLHLIEKEPILLYEFVMKCRDSSHELWGNTEQDLKDRSLMQPDGSIRESIKNIVLSAVTGELINMRIVNPIEEQCSSNQ